MTRRKYTYDYPRPALTADSVVFGLDDETLKVLLIRRERDPFAGRWALPGGFVNMDETLDQAARRELEEESGLRIGSLEQLQAFGAVDRDPRGRTVTVAYYALVRVADCMPRAASDAREVRWWPAGRTPRLAFDHAKIVRCALERLREQFRGRQPVGRELLPPKFTLRHLQQLYETVLGRPFDKRNFRKRMLGTSLLVELDEWESQVAHRAARLYRF